MDKSLCRIGVFYDGSYFTYAQNFFYGKKYEWLQPSPFHILIEDYIREKEQGFSTYKVVYAAWNQGLFTVNQSTENNFKLERNRRRKSFASPRLLNACNYSMNVNKLEENRRYNGAFKGLFRQTNGGEHQ